jgi:4-amino-4-deoxy-L-arabinose transferase-like glycosyltransferase
MPMNSNRKAWIVTWIFTILPLLGWWMYGLFDMDEGFYGAVVSEMNQRGEWITPYYNGHPWFEKPILLYWLAKPCMFLLGDWFGPRLPSILATIGTYMLVAWFAKRRWNDETARWCVLVAASSLLLVGVGRMMMTDALLSFCLAGAFIFFWESLVDDSRWRILSAFFLGLSVLAKGPVGLILFAPVIAWTLWRERGKRPAFRGAWLLGIVVLAITVAAWYVPAYLVNGQEFVQKFLIEQNFNRFTGGDPAHTPPFLTGLPMYFLVLLAGMAPWSFYIWKAWRRPTDTDEESELKRYLIVWALVPFIFFTVSKAKLPHYVLPCCVPLALLVGNYLANTSKRRLDAGIYRLQYPLIACAITAVLVNAAFLLYYNVRELSGHAQVHRLAMFVRNHIQPGEDVSAYQMPRRQRALGTGMPKIQETSHPSLVMYLHLPPDQSVHEPDTIAQLLADPRPQWIITRWNRIGDQDLSDIRKSGRELKQIETPGKQDLYRLYYLATHPQPRTQR